MADENTGAANSGAGAAFEGAQRAGEAMRAQGQRMADHSSSLGVAMIDQAQENAQQAFAAMRAAAKAKDLSDVMRIQSDYLREQSQRSMNQAREIGELIMKLGRNAVAPMQGGGKSG